MQTCVVLWKKSRNFYKNDPVQLKNNSGIFFTDTGFLKYHLKRTINWLDIFIEGLHLSTNNIY